MCFGRPVCFGRLMHLEQFVRFEDLVYFGRFVRLERLVRLECLELSRNRLQDSWLKHEIIKSCKWFEFLFPKFMSGTTL